MPKRPPGFPFMPAVPIALLASCAGIGVASCAGIGVANWRRLRRLEDRLDRMDLRPSGR